MAESKSDGSVLGKIKRLVSEEHGLYGHQSLEHSEQIRLDEIRVELDQCWDLLRQRRALREFGDDPDHAHVRSGAVVENYQR